MLSLARMGLHPAILLLPALLPRCANTEVATRCEFMRKDDLLSQCMKKNTQYLRRVIFFGYGSARKKKQ